MTADRPGRQLLAHALPMFAAAMAALLSSCGGNTIPPPGTPVVTFTATNKTFASYIVAIDSITFTGADGSFATPLVSPETVDLAKLSDLGELVQAPAVPSDTYTSATVTLDYTAASVWVQDNGSSVHVTPVLPGGTGLLTAAITITFDPAHPLVITAYECARVTLNFDLDAFNYVNLPAQTVSVNPFVTMSQPPLDSNPLRARGLFVYTGSDFFVMNLRPFFDLVSALGAVYVDVSSTTYYNVNGTVYTGDAGLKAMSSMLINTPIAVYGTLSSLNTITPSFKATTVLVGTALESEGLADHLQGVVAARSGNTLTVIGGDYLYTTNVSDLYAVGGTYYLPSTQVTIGSATQVFRDGDVASFNPQSISVGQEVDIAGASTVTTSGSVSMNATAGQVRLLSTRAWGVLTTATPNSLSLDLASLADFDPGAFNLTGVALGGGEVSKSAYPVNTGTVDPSAIAPNTLVAVDGVAAPFGTAPPAFNAAAVTVGTSTQQELIIEWTDGGSPHPFLTIRPNELIVNLDDTHLDTLHAIYTGPQALDILTLPRPLVITSTGVDASDLVLAVGNNTLTAGVSIFTGTSGPTAFATAVGFALDGTNNIFRLVALGQYNSAANTFVASRINVSLQN
jgi:hypothetical protein